MSTPSSSNKRIAKNTLMLYLRMLITMTVTLYTSRIILKSLGVDDFGIYNVVGGLVSMFSVLSGSLSSAISRFITFELGRGESNRLKIIFSTGINIQVGLSIVVIIIAEIVGLWFLNYKMNIPPERLYAANWVFQFSVLTFVVGLLSVPYNAAIIAHEKMSAFAYISVLDVVLRLVIVYLLTISPIDRLITFSFLTLCIGVFIRFIYRYYCKKHFAECTYHFVYDKTILKSMTSFAGWNFLGHGAFILNTQGVNILMNMYFGVAVNAARGIAMQVDGTLKQFVNNFTQAVNPQITKLYAQGDLESMHKLVCRSSKFSAFLMLFFAVPIILESDIILKLWLKTPPDYATVFLKWIIISSFMDSVLANSLVVSMLATGDIKKYQIVVTTVGCLVFPLSWIAFEFGCNPEMGYILYFAVYSILLFVRLYLLRDMVKLPMMMYIREVLFKITPTIVICFAIPSLLLFTMHDGITRLIVTALVSTIVVITTVYAIGLTKGEKRYLIDLVTKISLFRKISNWIKVKLTFK